MLLEGKRIILTGGATGIGRAAAQRVTRDGAKLAFSDVNDDDAATCLREIKDMGGDARYWRVDVVHEDQVKSAVGEAVDWLGGGADVLLNIAGPLGGSSSFACGSSKGGTHGLTMAPDSQLDQHGIRVNGVLPEALDTPLKRAQVERSHEVTGDIETYERTMSRLASPDGVANVMAWLASGEASYARGGLRTI